MYNHALKLDYNFKDNLNIALIYNYIKGFTYSAYNQNSNTNVITSAIQNYNYRQSLGLEGNIPVKICNAYSFNIYGQAVREYFKYTNKTNEVDYNESNSFSFNLNHRIKLPFKFNSNITMVYESATVYGIYTFKPLYYCNIGLSKNVLSGKGSLKLSITDPLDTKSNRYSTQAFDLDLTAKEKTESRSVRLAFTYQIGRKRDVKKQIKTDEQNRMK